MTDLLTSPYMDELRRQHSAPSDPLAALRHALDADPSPDAQALAQGGETTTEDVQ